MKQPFELEWHGGAVEACYRRLRPLDDLPWETLDPSAYPPALVERARLSWTDGALGEYASAASFAALLRDLLEARAPVDLVGMAGAFVADEMLHCELNARVATALGGAAPYLVDFETLAAPTGENLSPTARALERAVRLCCVGETLSVPLLAGTARAATHPVTRAVLQRLAHDEPPHAAFGWHVLAWASDRLDDAERHRLVAAALDAVSDYASDWLALEDAAPQAQPFAPEHVSALGWMEGPAWRKTAWRAVSAIGSRLRRAGLPAQGFEARAWSPATARPDGSASPR